MDAVVPYTPEVLRDGAPTREQFEQMMELDAQFQEIKRQRAFSVVMHNVLAENNMYEIAKNAGLKVLTTQEQRLLLYLISKISPTDSELKEQIFTVREFCAVIGAQPFADGTNPGGKDYKAVKDTVKGLGSHSMWLEMPNGELILTRWLESAMISPGSGTIKTKMDSKLAPYLIGLSRTRTYTAFPLHDVLRFRSRYSFPLYEILHANAFKKTYVTSVEKLRKQLGCTAKSYAAFGHFRQKVLESALEDINQYSELKVDYDTIKQGNKAVTAIEFHITSLKSSGNAEDRAEMEVRYERGERELNESLYQQYVKNASQNSGQFSIDGFGGEETENLCNEKPKDNESPLKPFTPEWKQKMREEGIHPLGDNDSPEAWIDIMKNVIGRVQEQDQKEFVVEEVQDDDSFEIAF